MIKLGSVVRDLITGMTGTAIGRTEWLYGCARIAVESTELKKDGQPSGDVWLDEQRVEFIEDGKVQLASEKEFPIELGSECRDRVTGFSGIAVARTRWLAGDANVTIEPTRLHEGKPIAAHAFSVERIELIVQQPPPVSRQSSAKSGGPQNDPQICR